jgi:photosystem II stability/assembly factor-like uncharacterized protein
MPRCCVIALLLLANAGILLAADDPIPGAPRAGKDEWVELDLKVAGKKAFLTALAADRTTGDVYTLLHHGAPHTKGSQGLWKSTDKGVTFARIDGGKIGGGGWNAFSIDIDPAGKRLAVFPMYGTGALTLDAGKTWRPIGEHFDYGSVDWSDPDAQTIMATHHERKPGMRVSTNGGNDWRPLGFPDRDALGVLDSKTLLHGSGAGIFRSLDSGQTWKKVHDKPVTSRAVRVYKGRAYFLTDAGVLVSDDKGATWQIQGTPPPDVDAWIGPIFGKSEAHLLVIGPKGIFESTDAAKSWNLVAPLPAAYKGKFGDRNRSWANGPHLGYDPDANMLYICLANQPAYRWER